jgi:glycopeptide antibiotics resistance protein
LRVSRFGLILSIGLIIYIVFPWRSYQEHAHWQRIQWLPFVSPPVRLRDIIGNIVLYVPFGFFIAASTRRRDIWKWGMACAVALALATEFTQVFSHRRFPSMQDVLTNGLGAALGIAIWAAVGRRAVSSVGS